MTLGPLVEIGVSWQNVPPGSTAEISVPPYSDFFARVDGLLVVVR